MGNGHRDPRYDNRLRMTLGHEYGHVWFDAPLWRKSGADRPDEPQWTCHRDRIVDAPQDDWMEFQAAYIGGALLMPKNSICLWGREITIPEAKEPLLSAGSDLGNALIERIVLRLPGLDPSCTSPAPAFATAQRGVNCGLARCPISNRSYAQRRSRAEL